MQNHHSDTMIIDILLAITAAYGFFLGFSKGIIKTVFTVLSVIFGMIAAFKFSPAMTDFLETTFSTHPMMFLVGFLLSFVLTMVFIRMVARFIEGALETANINILNQMAGGILLTAMLVLFYSALLWFGDQSRLIDDKTKVESITYPYLEQYPKQVWKVVKGLGPTFENFWDHSLDFFDKVEDMGGLEKEETKTEIIDMDNDSSRSPRR